MSNRPSTRHHWLWGYLRPEWRALSGGIVVVAARAGVLLLLPWPLKFIIDNVIFQRPLPGWIAATVPALTTHRMTLLDTLGLVMLALGGLDALLVYLGNRLFLDAGQRIIFSVRFDLFAHLQRLSLDFHRRQRAGEVMTRLNGDVKQVQDFIASVGVDLIPHSLTIIGMAGVMLLLDWRYALLALAVTPVLVWIAGFYGERLRHELRTVRRHEGTLAGVAQEILSSVQMVQAFARERFEDARFTEYADRTLVAGLRANAVQSQFVPAMNLAIAAASGLIAWYGAANVIRGALSPGELLVFLAYLRGIATPARQLAKTGRVFGRAAVALERIDEYRAEQPRIGDRPGALTPAHPARAVRFASVSFGYQPDRLVLRDVSFSLEPGRTVALVGATGSGKSTIASLLPRFYDPDAGTVLMDERDIRDLRLAYLRRQVALLLQEPVLFSGTIWENIAYGREGAGREDAIAAASAVGIADMVAALPDGFDTEISERGQSLSGGQRQCVAIARAMLSDAPLVILDEPSASLDATTEQKLMQALARLTQDRAALVIAHRLSTVRHADEILVLDKGRIVQRGHHNALLAEGGVYGKLWQALSSDTSAQPHLRLVAP